LRLKAESARKIKERGWGDQKTQKPSPRRVGGGKFTPSRLEKQKKGSKRSREKLPKREAKPNQVAVVAQTLETNLQKKKINPPLKEKSKQGNGQTSCPTRRWGNFT